MPKQGLFRKKQVEEPRPNEEMLELVRRSRTLEQRYATLERRSQVLEENTIEHNRKLASEIRALNEEVTGIKKSISDLHEKIQLLVTELQNFSLKEDVQVLKKYLDYWDPLKFVTQDQVEKIVKEMIDDKKS